jgi:hypothetical protein
VGLTWPEHRPIEGEACSPLVDDTCTPSDIALSSMNFLRTSLMEFSNSVGSLDIITVKQVGRGRRTGNRGRRMGNWGRQMDNDV